MPQLNPPVRTLAAYHFGQQTLSPITSSAMPTRVKRLSSCMDSLSRCNSYETRYPHRSVTVLSPQNYYTRFFFTFFHFNPFSVEMKKPARVNTSPTNGEKLRKVQAEYNKKFRPATISIEALNDLSIELGIGLVRKKLNLT